MDGISAIQSSLSQASAVELTPVGSQPAIASSSGSQGTSGTTAVQGHHHHHHHGGGSAMGAASQVLGMSTSDLAAALQSGQSLASIAASKGVSTTALVNALATAISGSNSNLTPDQASQIASQLATRTPGSQGQASEAGIQQASANTWAAAAQQVPVSTFEINA